MEGGGETKKLLLKSLSRCWILSLDEKKRTLSCSLLCSFPSSDRSRPDGSRSSADGIWYFPPVAVRIQHTSPTPNPDCRTHLDFSGKETPDAISKDFKDSRMTPGGHHLRLT